MVIILMIFQDSLSFYDIMDALKLDPEHLEAKTMLTALIEKAENFKEKVIT
jgi:hypothetical protein